MGIVYQMCIEVDKVLFCALILHLNLSGFFRECNERYSLRLTVQ